MWQGLTGLRSWPMSPAAAAAAGGVTAAAADELSTVMWRWQEDVHQRCRSTTNHSDLTPAAAATSPLKSRSLYLVSTSL